MATLLRGFQANTTIHAAFWIYKPDSVDPTAKEILVEVNGIQRIESNQESVVANIQQVQLISNQLTVFVDSVKSLRALQTGGNMAVLFRNLQNATFLNGQAVIIQSIDTVAKSFVASFLGNGDIPHPDYSLAGDSGQVLDTSNRSVDIYYATTGVSTAQTPTNLTGVIASYFLYDMEALFS